MISWCHLVGDANQLKPASWINCPLSLLWNNMLYLEQRDLGPVRGVDNLFILT